MDYEWRRTSLLCKLKKSPSPRAFFYSRGPPSRRPGVALDDEKKGRPESAPGRRLPARGSKNKKTGEDPATPLHANLFLRTRVLR